MDISNIQSVLQGEHNLLKRQQVFSNEIDEMRSELERVGSNKSRAVSAGVPQSVDSSMETSRSISAGNSVHSHHRSVRRMYVEMGDELVFLATLCAQLAPSPPAATPALPSSKTMAKATAAASFSSFFFFLCF